MSKDELKKDFRDHSEEAIKNMVASIYVFSYFNKISIEEAKVIAFECLFDEIEVTNDNKALEIINETVKKLDLIWEMFKQ